MARPVSCVSDVQRQNFHVLVQQPVLCPVASPVPFVLNVRGQPQKKGGSPSSNMSTEINFVKSVFSVDHCAFACTVPSAHNVANVQLVGGRLQKFWQKLSLLDSSVHLKGRLHSSVQNQASSSQRSIDSQWLCKPPQEPLPQGGFASPTTKGGSRDGEGSNISSLLQQTFHSSQTKPKMATSVL